MSKLLFSVLTSVLLLVTPDCPHQLSLPSHQELDLMRASLSLLPILLTPAWPMTSIFLQPTGWGFVFCFWGLLVCFFTFLPILLLACGQMQLWILRKGFHRQVDKTVVSFHVIWKSGYILSIICDRIIYWTKRVKKNWGRGVVDLNYDYDFNMVELQLPLNVTSG